MRILLVEDNPDDVRMTMRAIKQSGIKAELLVAEDGERALARLAGRAAAPDLVLLDIKLPKISGIEVLKSIRASGALRSLPVVMLTSSDEERDLVEAYGNGANSYLQKPVDYDRFMEIVGQAGRYWSQCNTPPPGNR